MRDRSRFIFVALGVYLAALLAVAPTASAGVRTVMVEMFTNTG